MGESEIQWQAPEFEYHAKDVSWYWGSIVVAVLVLGFAVWQKNFLFGFFVVIAEILILTWAGRTPKLRTFKIAEKGLEIVGQKMYSWNDLDSFSVDENRDGENPRIVFRLKKIFHAALTVGMPRSRREEIREQLISFLPEHEYEPSLIDGLERFFGF